MMTMMMTMTMMMIKKVPEHDIRDPADDINKDCP